MENKKKINTEELNQRVADWEKRNEENKQKDADADQDRADRLRADYMKRTGRREMKP